MSHRYQTIAAGVAAALLMPAAPAAAAEPSICHVGYQTYGDSLSFVGEIVISNTGPATLNGWTLTFPLAAGQTFREGWEALFAAEGQDVTARSLTHNSVVEPGRSVWVGFHASGDVAGPRPAEFRVNGHLCTTS